MDDEARVPAWVLGELPEPHGVAWTLYLDDAERIEPHREVLELWHATVAETVLPAAQAVCLPANAPVPRERLLATGERGRPARIRRWQDGLTEDLFQLQAGWWMEVDEPYMTYHVGLYVFRFQPRHAKLETTATVPAGSTAGVVSAMVELAVRLGNATNLAYGQITVNDHAAAPYFTKLDVALRRNPFESADASRTVLRGYEWVTVLPAELLRTVGGADMLRASGAFVDVAELTGGGAVLRATNTPAEFTGTRVEAVAAALAPILPSPGRIRGPAQDL